MILDTDRFIIMATNLNSVEFLSAWSLWMLGTPTSKLMASLLLLNRYWECIFRPWKKAHNTYALKKITARDDWLIYFRLNLFIISFFHLIWAHSSQPARFKTRAAEQPVQVEPNRLCQEMWPIGYGSVLSQPIADGNLCLSNQIDIINLYGPMAISISIRKFLMRQSESYKHLGSQLRLKQSFHIANTRAYDFVNANQRQDDYKCTSWLW